MTEMLVEEKGKEQVKVGYVCKPLTMNNDSDDLKIIPPS